MRKIAVVVTARPSFARIRTVLEALQGRDVDVRIIMAASTLLHHYGEVANDCPFPVAHHVCSTLAGNTLETTATETGLLAIKLSAIFAAEKPDVVVTIADRHETLATAMAASYQHIPLAHLQGGEQTGSIDDKVRNAVSMLSDLHFVATGLARWKVGRLMDGRGRVIQTGCPSLDIAARAKHNPLHANTIVVMQHPVTNEAADAASQIEETYHAVASFTCNTIVWLWPGQDAGTDASSKRLREIRERFSPRIDFRRHLPADEFLSLLRSCAVLVGNSSAGIREASFLGTPVVNVGSRQLGRERDRNVVDVERYEAVSIRQAILDQLRHGRYEASHLYGDGHAGPRIADILCDPKAVVSHPG